MTYTLDRFEWFFVGGLTFLTSLLLYKILEPIEVLLGAAIIGCFAVFTIGLFVAIMKCDSSRMGCDGY